MEKNSKVWIGRFYGLLAILAAIAITASYRWISPRAAIFGLLGVLLLAAGFKITEVLVGILTKTRSANASGVVLFLGLKVAWWGSVFLIATKIQKTDAIGFAIGFAVFLLAILIQGLWAVGIPKVSPPKKDS